MTGTSMQNQEWIGKFVDDSGKDLGARARAFAETYERRGRRALWRILRRTQ